MVAVHMFTAIAQKETAKQAMLKQLREAGATSPAMPGSVEIDSDDAQSALAELLAAGTVREARNGLYYVDETKKAPGPGNGFVALLVILVLFSVIASVIAIAATSG